MNDHPNHGLGGLPALRDVLDPRNLALLTRGDRFVVMASGLIVVAALGALAVLRDRPVIAMVLALVAMAIVAGLVVMVHLRSVAMRDLEAHLVDQGAAAAAVNGDWWQLVWASDHPGLTYVSIAISEAAERHAMHGITYDEHGRRKARWSSDTVAVKTSTPVEVYYVWRGMLLGGEVANIVSGLGRFRFDSVGREQRPLQAEGAFTRGETVELRFEDPRPCELVRFTEAESRRLAADPHCLDALAAEAFARFGLEPGRAFGAQP